MSKQAVSCETSAAPLIRVSGVRKSYGHIDALRGVDLEIGPAEVVGLIGDNGAGKSTLVKILSGAERPDAGRIEFDGREVSLSSSHQAKGYGMETVYQDLALAPDLDAAANLYLGRELRRSGVLGRVGWLDRKRMREGAEQSFRRLGVDIKDITAPIAQYSGGQQQGVAIARAATWAKRVLLLDEPTAALGVVQTRAVLDLIRRIADAGTAVILVSHNMSDVLAVCDRVCVLRLGRCMANFDASTVTTDELIGAMTGLTADAGGQAR